MNMKDRIAQRTAKELNDGDVVNLGIGIPTLVVNYLPIDTNIFIHSENGILGAGPTPAPDKIIPNLVNAGKLPITSLPGASYFNSADSFAMIRGSHIDVAILGVLEVDETGLIANWSIPGETVLGVGGAMDLLIGAKKIIATITHTTKDGKPKIVQQCKYPVTGLKSIDTIITELCVFRVEDNKLILEELAPGVTLDEVQEKTEAHFIVGDNI